MCILTEKEDHTFQKQIVQNSTIKEWTLKEGGILPCRCQLKERDAHSFWYLQLFLSVCFLQDLWAFFFFLSQIHNSSSVKGKKIFWNKDVQTCSNNVPYPVPIEINHLVPLNVSADVLQWIFFIIHTFGCRTGSRCVNMPIEVWYARLIKVKWW